MGTPRHSLRTIYPKCNQENRCDDQGHTDHESPNRLPASPFPFSCQPAKKIGEQDRSTREQRKSNRGSHAGTNLFTTHAEHEYATIPQDCHHGCGTEVPKELPALPEGAPGFVFVKLVDRV